VWLPEVVAALTSQTRPIDLITAVDTGSQDASTKLLKIQSNYYSAQVLQGSLNFTTTILHVQTVSVLSLSTV
jgi:hypothetical protein